MNQPGICICRINDGLQLNVNSVSFFCFIAFFPTKTLCLRKKEVTKNLQKVGMGKLNVALLSTKSENCFHQVSFVKPFLGS